MKTASGSVCLCGKSSVNADSCIGCKACLGIGCPAISIRDGKACIDRTQCVGCGVCESLCPKKAIGGAAE